MSDVFADALSGRLAQWGLCVPPGLVEGCGRYYSLLVSANRTRNLTGITEPAEAALRHFADALNPAAHLALKGCGSVVDMGTGAGFPGVPLALRYPEKRFFLVDSLGKRIEFLRAAKDELPLGNVEIIHARAEDFGRENLERFDAVVCRAVAGMPVLLEYALPVLRVGGLLCAWKGPAVAEEIPRSRNALNALGGGEIRLLEYRLENNLTLFAAICKKEKASSPAFPRRAGLALKKPL